MARNLTVICSPISGHLYESPHLWRAAADAFRTSLEGWAICSDEREAELLREYGNAVPTHFGEYAVLEDSTDGA